MKKYLLFGLLAVMAIFLTACQGTTYSGSSGTSGAVVAANNCRQIQEPYVTQVPYTDREPYTATETYYETETYDIPKETQWKVDWYTITGSGQWGAKVGSDTLPATFLKSWGNGVVFSQYADYVGFIATAEINVPVSGLVTFITGSDDGLELSIDGDVLVDLFYDHSYTERQTPVTLEKGKHALRLRYYERRGIAKVKFDTSNREILSWNEQGQQQVKKTREAVKYHDVTKYRTETKHRTITKCD